ncbi:hypothetical protein EJ110_NYTH31328 [Nymphaea thermarum]|nr:hypothetical protein EJ110_NYTH31328 [Nymphaea thermarum]
MVSGSLSILSSSSSLPYRNEFFVGLRSASDCHFSRSNTCVSTPSSRSSLTLPLSVSCSLKQRQQQDDDDGGVGRFMGNNSIADFMRFRRKNDGDGQLQTAVVSYRKKFPWSLVDLVSTIHIADKEYFATLQKDLESYDCILYEMVASRESLENRRNKITSKRLKSARSKGFNILGFIQRQMARVLSLDFQLDCLDYESRNWFHADLDYETFKSLQMERGESFFSFARDMTLRSAKAVLLPSSALEELGPWKSKLLWASRVLPMPLVGLFIIGGVCSQYEIPSSEYSELNALSRLDFGSALKIFLAKRLTTEFTQVTAAVEEKSVIIGERNRAALEALEKTLDGGYKRIAILYGGGHMPDLGRRLREDFNMVPSNVSWVTAWSITNDEQDGNIKQSFPFLKALAEVSGWPLNRYQTLALLIFSSVLAIDLWFWEIFFGSVVHWAAEAASEITHIVGHSHIVIS